MSMRRCVTVLAMAMLGALCAAPTAGARTKTVVAGGPPPTANLAGSAKFPAELDLNGFFRRRITINVGDSVRWTFSHRVVHTVTFLPLDRLKPRSEGIQRRGRHALGLPITPRPTRNTVLADPPKLLFRATRQRIDCTVLERGCSEAHAPVRSSSMALSRWTNLSRAHARSSPKRAAQRATRSSRCSYP